MIGWSAALLIASAIGAPASDPASPQRFAQLLVQERIVIRTRPRPPRVPPTPIEWRESKGPKCIAARSIAGAALLGANSVDLMLRTGERLRARLERSCPALDYYRGFYISPGGDGRICADRDTIRSRVGGQCGIDAFRTLRAKARKAKDRPERDRR